MSEEKKERKPRYIGVLTQQKARDEAAKAAPRAKTDPAPAPEDKPKSKPRKRRAKK